LGFFSFGGDSHIFSNEGINCETKFKQTNKILKLSIKSPSFSPLLLSLLVEALRKKERGDETQFTTKNWWGKKN
jgi:hypothetical protein